MKRIISIALIIVACVVAVRAQDGNRWMVSAMYAWDNDEITETNATYTGMREARLEGEYQMKICKILYFQPSMSLDYKRYKNLILMLGGCVDPSAKYPSHDYNTLYMGMSPKLGIKWSPIKQLEINPFTGPDVMFLLWKHSDGIFYINHKPEYKSVFWTWNFGVNVALWEHYVLRIGYNLGLSPRSTDWIYRFTDENLKIKPSTWTVGVGYKF